MDERLDARSAAAARRYGGHLTRRQLLALGLTSRQIESRIERGWLIPVSWGVYAVGHKPVLPVDRAHGALLAVGPHPHAFLSHRSAGSLLQLFKDWRFPFEVTTTDDRRVKGITIHRSTTLRRRDTTVQLGVRTTTVARTIFDLAPRLTERALERIIDQALHTPVPEDRATARADQPPPAHSRGATTTQGSGARPPTHRLRARTRLPVLVP